MTHYLEVSVDKFTFKIADDRFYTKEGLWAQVDESASPRIRIGLSDFLQQRSGDVAFAEIKEPGEHLAFDGEAAVIETIKVNLSLGSPAAGQVVEVNPAMADAPEVINQDPYGAGWMAVIEAEDWDADKLRLLDAQAYFAHVRAVAEQEIK